MSKQASNSVEKNGNACLILLIRYLVEKCNETLVDDTMKKVVFIGVLDIAGFEIFEVKLNKLK